jgi:hypothetical protein
MRSSTTDASPVRMRSCASSAGSPVAAVKGSATQKKEYCGRVSRRE